MKIKTIITSSILASAIFAAPAFAAATKFAAAWESDVVSVKAEIVSESTTGANCSGTSGISGGGTEETPCVLVEHLLTTIDVAQQKDLLIGVSGQIGLVTLTQAKGKSTESTLGSATASGNVVVTLLLKDSGGNVVQTAAPGPVIFAARSQELKVGATATEGEIEVLVSLKLSTTAAHHFNFIGVDLDQGVYDVVAVFDLSAFVAIVGEEAIAEAEVILGPRMVTVQEVRAAKGELVVYVEPETEVK